MSTRPARSYYASSMAGASGRMPPTTPSLAPKRRSGTGWWRAGRIRISKPASIMSGCPTGRWAIPRFGHTNLGAGRVVMQDLPRIDAAVKSGELAKMPALGEFVAKVKAKGGTAHVVGLMSPGGVHSHQGQIAALARIIADAGVEVAVHAVLDGRDTPPKSAKGYLQQFAADTKGADVKIATIAGRFYAMDRDKRWDRVAKAYRALTAGVGEKAPDPVAALDAGYGRGETRRVRAADRDRWLQGNAGRRRAAARQFPRRSRPGNRRRAARLRILRLRARAHGQVFRRARPCPNIPRS